MPNQSASLDRVLHAESDTTRGAIVHRLSRGPAAVSELDKPFSMAMPSLLQHLQVLEASRLIHTEKVGRVRTCAIEPVALDVAHGWIAEQQAIWEARLDRMETYIATLQSKEKKHGKRQKTS